MKKTYLSLSVLAAAISFMPLTGCIDKDYDLSDIDTNVRVEVKDLEVPVNLDAITLSNIFDLNDEDDESVIKEVGDGYAVLVSGDFSSTDIRVGEVRLSNIGVSPVSASIQTGGAVLPPGVSSMPVNLPFSDISTAFSFINTTVDKSIRRIDNVKVSWTVVLTLDFSSVASLLRDVTVKDLVLQLPDGLVSSSHDIRDGLVSLGDRALDANGCIVEIIDVSAIDVENLPADEFRFTPDALGIGGGNLSYHGSIGIKSGIIDGTLNSGVTLPASVDIVFSPNLGSYISVNNFSGILSYSLDSFDVQSVELNDMPDVLTQEDTRIKIANPQLYFSINNPVAPYEGVAHTGMSLTPVRDNGASAPCVLPASSRVTIGYDKGIAGPYNFCLSPEKPAEMFKDNKHDYTGAEHRIYPALADVLYGDGLPRRIDVSFEGAGIGGDDNPVTDFPIGVTLPNDVTGSYTFYAPLSFGENSQVVYAGDDDGWSDDTLEKLTVRKVGVRATVDNTLPFDIVLSGYPVRKNAHGEAGPITDASGKKAEFSSVTVKAGETTDIALETNGVLITDLDGIHYEAKALVTKPGVQLRPSATITLTGIRAVVSGYYEDEL